MERSTKGRNPEKSKNKHKGKEKGAKGKGGKSNKGKGKPPRGFNDDETESDFLLYDSFNSPGGSRSRPRGPNSSSTPKHPPWLKGKDIGLYYAEISKQKKTQRSPKSKSSGRLISLRRSQEARVDRFLRDSGNVNVLQQSLNLSNDWQSKYELLSDSKFKQQFLDTLDGNDRCSFGGTDRNVCSTNLKRDAILDGLLFESLTSRGENTQYVSMQQARAKLPVHRLKEAILEEIRESQVTVICGETGCGKTTQVVQFLLDDAILQRDGSKFRAVCTQPRRLAAISVAQRVAEERCEPCGGLESSVGYQIRLEARVPRPRGSVLFCTTGILIQFLQSDPFLEGVSHLLIDEVHERDILNDFLVTVVKDVLPRRPDLRVVLMSATINAEMFSQYFGNCPVVHVPGFTFPVQDLFLEDVLAATNFRVHSRYSAKGKSRKLISREDVEYTELIVPYVEHLEENRSYPRHVTISLRMRESEEASEDLILSLLRFICSEKGPGAILVFLPGWEQISRLHRLLTSDRYFSGRNYLVIPLHSMMPTVSQKTVFDRPPRGVRKIVLSTNIAETSLTIDDVVYVIDCGKAKQSSYDPKRNIDTLKPEWISQANARQRRGRAGRVQAGVCYRLYSRAREQCLLAHPIPEMQRTRLEEVILQLKILRLGKVERFMSQVLEPPYAPQVAASLGLLRALGALDDAEHLTPLGFHLAKLPTDPRTGKLLIMGAVFGCLEPITAIAAALSFKDPFVTPLHKEEQVRQTKQRLAGGTHSDHLLFARVMSQYDRLRREGWPAAKDFCYQNFLSSSTMSMLHDMMHQFARELCENQFIQTPSPKDREANRNSGNNDLIRAVLCSALLPNVAQILSGIPKGKKKGQNQHAGPAAKILTMSDGRVYIHPRSVNFNERYFDSCWLVYHQKVKTSQIFLHDCSEVSAFALLFFGQNVRRSKRGSSRQLVSIDGGITLTCDSITAELIFRLRQRFDQMLSHRVSHPGSTDWSPTSQEGSLLRTIIDVLSPGQLEDEDFAVEDTKRLVGRKKRRQPELLQASFPIGSSDDQDLDVAQPLGDDFEIYVSGEEEGEEEEDDDEEAEEEEETDEDSCEEEEEEDDLDDNFYEELE